MGNILAGSATVLSCMNTGLTLAASRLTKSSSSGTWPSALPLMPFLRPWSAIFAEVREKIARVVRTPVFHATACPATRMACC